MRCGDEATSLERTRRVVQLPLAGRSSRWLGKAGSFHSTAAEPTASRRRPHARRHHATRWFRWAGFAGFALPPRARARSHPKTVDAPPAPSHRFPPRPRALRTAPPDTTRHDTSSFGQLAPTPHPPGPRASPGVIVWLRNSLYK